MRQLANYTFLSFITIICIPAAVEIGKPESPGPLQTPLPLLLALAGAFFIPSLNLTLFVTGRSPFATLLPLVVDPANADQRLTVSDSLDLQALMTDPGFQPVPLIGPILHVRPLLAPKEKVLLLVVLPVLRSAKTFRPDGPSGHNEVDMGVPGHRKQSIP